MLNEAQRRCVLTSLRLIEKHLRVIEGLDISDGNGILKEVKNDIPVSTQAAIREKTAIIREDIKILSNRFHLSKTLVNTRAIALASLSYCWEILEDTTSKKLKKYGATAEELQTTLDPLLNEILDELLEIESLLRK